tara:strand:+ start:7026 stop:7346 length:321 start_codon:yes stop_codon:yes gene_type:complete
MTTATKKNGKKNSNSDTQFEDAAQGDAPAQEQPKPVSLAKPNIDPEVTREQLQGQLNYAQKIINVLQGKVNELNGKMVQLEAQLLVANEDRENILKQVETMGITPQ